MIYRFIRFYYHCDIPWQFNPEGIYFNHKGFGIVINPNAIVGSGTSIQHSVTIGQTDKGCPVIGNNCYIGAAAMIIGPVKIGNNVIIGASTVVVNDIPDYAVVVGNPGKVIRFNNPLVL